jgi:hypothetical protein
MARFEVGHQWVVGFEGIAGRSSNRLSSFSDSIPEYIMSVRMTIPIFERDADQLEHDLLAIHVGERPDQE